MVRTIQLVVGRTNVEIPALEVGSVQFDDRLFAVLLVPHGHESKPAGLSGVVVDHDGLPDRSDGLEDLAQVLLGGLPGNVSDVHLEIAAVLGVSFLLDVELDAFHVAVRQGDHFEALSQGRYSFAGLEPGVAADGAFHAAVIQWIAIVLCCMCRIARTINTVPYHTIP